MLFLKPSFTEIIMADAPTWNTCNVNTFNIPSFNLAPPLLSKLVNRIFFLNFLVLFQYYTHTAREKETFLCRGIEETANSVSSFFAVPPVVHKHRRAQTLKSKKQKRTRLPKPLLFTHSSQVHTTAPFVFCKFESRSVSGYPRHPGLNM